MLRASDLSPALAKKIGLKSTGWSTSYARPAALDVIQFDRQCALAGLPVPVAEYQFAKALSVAALTRIGQTKPRKWAIDWAFLDPHNLAVEVEGGYAVGGRHTRVKGFLADLVKYNALACLGWRVIRVTPRHIANGEALTWVALALGITTYGDQ